MSNFIAGKQSEESKPIMSSTYDLNTADTQGTLIPDGESVHVVIAFVAGDYGGPHNNDLHKSREGNSLMLRLEATVTEGKYAKRKFWPGYFMGLTSGALSEGQETGVSISRKMIRAMVEAGKGISPTDESPAAVNARKLKSLAELDGLEFWCVVGIEKGKGGFDDKNVIKRVLTKAPAGDGAFNPKAEAASMRQASPATTQKGW